MFPLQHTVILYSVIERKMVQSAIAGVFYITPSKWFTELHLEKKNTDSASKTTTFLNQSCFLDFSIIIVYVASSTVMTPTSFSQTTQCNSHSVQKAALRSILHVATEQTKKICSNLPTSWRLGIRRSKNTTKLTQDEGKSSSHCQCPGPLGTQGTSYFRFPGDTKKLTYIAS